MIILRSSDLEFPHSVEEVVDTGILGDRKVYGHPKKVWARLIDEKLGLRNKEEKEDDSNT